MTDTPTEKLNRALRETDEKSKALNDSLQKLAAQGFDNLAKAVSRANSPQTARKDAGDVAQQEMAKFLRHELAAGIATAFGGRAQAQGGQTPLSVVVHNNAGAQVSAQEGYDAFDRKTLEITIDQMVANSLMRGKETGGVLRTLFGIVPSLIGR